MAGDGPAITQRLRARTISHDCARLAPTTPSRHRLRSNTLFTPSTRPDGWPSCDDPIAPAIPSRHNSSLSLPVLILQQLSNLRIRLFELRMMILLLILEYTTARGIRNLAANGIDALVKAVIQRSISVAVLVVLDSFINLWDEDESPTAWNWGAVLAAYEARGTAREISGWVGQCVGEPVSYAVEMRLVQWWKSRDEPTDEPL